MPKRAIMKRISWTLCCVQDAQSYADDNSLLFMETSAKTSMNVNEIFMAIGEHHLLNLVFHVLYNAISEMVATAQMKMYGSVYFFF